MKRNVILRIVIILYLIQLICLHFFITIYRYQINLNKTPIFNAGLFYVNSIDIIYLFFYCCMIETLLISVLIFKNKLYFSFSLALVFLNILHFLFHIWFYSIIFVDLLLWTILAIISMLLVVIK